MLFIITGISLFEANTSINLVVYKASRPDQENTHFAYINIGHMQRIYKQMLLDIEFYINKAVFYYNKSYLGGPRFKRGDKVYLLRKNIKITRPLNKLDYKKIRLFKILD